MKDEDTSWPVIIMFAVFLAIGIVCFCYPRTDEADEQEHQNCVKTCSKHKAKSYLYNFETFRCQCVFDLK
jgi:hypothetical protein